MRSRKEMERMNPWMRKPFIGIVVLFLMALLAACGSQTSNNQPITKFTPPPLQVVPVFTQQVLVHTGQAAVIYTDKGGTLIYYSYNAESAANTLHDVSAQKTAIVDLSRLQPNNVVEVDMNACASTPSVWATVQNEITEAQIKVVPIKEIDTTVYQLARLHNVPPERIKTHYISPGRNC